MRVYRSGVAVLALAGLLSGACTGRVVASSGSFGGGQPRYLGLLTSARGWPVAFSPDGRYLAVAGGNSQSAGVWSLTTGKQVYDLDVGSVVASVAFSADSRRLATDGALFDLGAGRKIAALSGGYDVAFSGDGRYLATASGYDAFLGVVAFDPRTGNKRNVVTREYANALAFSPDGGYLATSTGYLERGVRIWDSGGGQLLRTVPGGGAPLAFGRSSRILAMTEGNHIALVDPATGARLHTIPGGKTMTFGPGNMVVVVASNGAVQLYAADTGARIRILRDVVATAAALTPDGTRVAALTKDGIVLVDATLGR